jgi:hypothetical protein
VFSSRVNLDRQHFIRHGLHINNNGVRVVSFATYKILIMKSAMFPHHSIHKYTWTSPDGRTHCQIDQILEKKRENSKIVHQLFIDFKKAHDSVRREALYSILWNPHEVRLAD